MNLKQNIKRHGFTLVELAHKMKGRDGKVGVTQATVTQIVNGNPTLSKLQEIADIMDIPLSTLVGGDNFTALVECDGRTYSAHSLDELESLVERLKKESTNV